MVWFDYCGCAHGMEGTTPCRTHDRNRPKPVGLWFRIKRWLKEIRA